MSRSLSSNVTTGIAGGARPCYLLQLEHAAGTYYWSTVPFTDGAQTYDSARIKKDGLGKIRQSINLDAGGNTEEITDWQFIVNNADDFHDTLAPLYFQNRRVALRLIYPDIAGASWDNAAKLFRGFVNDGPNWDTGQCVFKCTRGWYNRYRNMPTKQLTKARFPDMPDALEGQFIGVVYGDYFMGGTTTGVNRKAIAFSGLASSPYHHRDYIKGRMVKRITGTLASGWDAGGVLALSEHELKETYCDTDIERITKWDSGLAAFIGTDIDVTANGANGSYVGYDNPVGPRTAVDNQRGGYDKNILLAISGGQDWIHIIPTHDKVLSSASGYSNPNHCVDELPTNRTTISANNTDLAYVCEIVENGSALLWDSLKVYLERDGDETLDYTITDGTNTTTGTISTFGSTVSISLTGWTGNPLERAVRITFNSNQVGGAYANVYIKHLHLVVKRAATTIQAGDTPELFQSVRGRMFHKFIDTAGRSNAYSAGEVVQNPVHMVESLLYQKCQLTPAGLSYAVEFDGSNDGLCVKHSESLAITGDMSFFVWVYLDAQNSRGIIRKALTSASTVPAGFDYYLNASGIPVIARGNGSAYQEIAGTNAVGTGAWHRIGFKIEGDNVTHYKDGATNGTGSMSPVVQDLGGDIFFALPCRATNFFDGKMDEACLLNYAVSSAWVTADYNSGSGQYHEEGETGLVGLWHFDEGVGNEFRDWSGMGNDAGYQSPGLPTWVAGKVTTVQQYLESSFDTVGALRSAHKAGRQFLDNINVRDVIRELCYEFGFAFFEQPDGLPTVANIRATADSVTTYGNAHYAVTGQDNEPTFKVFRKPAKNIYTEFILRYQSNPATGEPMRVVFVKSPTSPAFDGRHTNLSADGSTYWQKCRDAYVNFKQIHRWEYTALNIREQATAEAVLKLVIDWLTRWPYECTWRSSLQTLALQLLDEAKLSHDQLPTGIDASARFRCTEQIIDLVTDEIDYKFLQVT